MPEVVSDPGIIRENVPDLKKLSRSLIKIIADKYSFTDSNQLDFFLVFDSRENLSTFLVNHESSNIPKTTEINDSIKIINYKNNKITILYEFNIISALLIRCGINLLPQLNADPLIASIEGNYRGYLCLNDYQVKMELPRIQSSFLKPSGKSIKIAVLDSGIYDDHPDLRGRVSNRFNITTEEEKDICGHGTMLAGIICGQNRTSINSMRGIALDAQLIDVKITDKTGVVFCSDILLGLESIQNEKVNIVLFGMNTPFETEGNDILSKACSLFASRGIILIAPSGNLGPDSDYCGTPAASRDVITVGSIDADDKIAFFSSRGNQIGNLKPDIVVPSVQISTTKSPNCILGTADKSNELYSIVSGTSMAAAVVAGIIALILELNPKLTKNKIIDALNATSTDLFYNKQSQGLGMPNLVRLFKYLNIYLENPLPYPNLVKKSLIITIILSGLSIVLFVVSSLIFNWVF